jgi:predicted amidohydrolase
VLARTAAREGLALAELDLAAVEGSRMVIDHLADRRPEAYGAPMTAAVAALGIVH